MITTLKSFEIRSKDTGNLIAKFSLKLNGYTYELHSTTEVIMCGIEAERHYNESLELNKMIVDNRSDMELIEIK